MAHSYFEGLVFLFFNIPILPVIVLNVMGMSLGDSILRRVVPFLRFHVDDKYVSYNVMDVYYLNFFIRVILNKMTLLSVL